MTYRKKLIEVALPLEKINQESAREKSIRHGHPSTLHLWWARRPLAACRAVLFASIIDDPDQEGVPEALLQRIDRLPMPEKRPLDWGSLSLGEQRRQRLFGLIERLVPWENSNDEEILRTAKELIHAATDGTPPPVLDPFCGGGSIPLEAQRLGLEAHASDLNPVAVLITKALIEIPPKFAGMPPVNPMDRARGAGAAWKGAAGLAADVRYYGKWMRDEAEKRIGHLYPKVKLPKEHGGGDATVVAWLWARTVKCPNPACGAQMPLVRSFWLSTKAGKKAWLEPVVDRAARTVLFEVRTGQGMPQDGTIKNRSATCPVCGTVAPLPYVRAEAQGGRMDSTPLAIVADAPAGRTYVSPSIEHMLAAESTRPTSMPDERVPTPCHDVDRLPMYGMYTWSDVFTRRQLVAITTFVDIVGSARDAVHRDAEAVVSSPHDPRLGHDTVQAIEYARAVSTYLMLAVDKAIDRNTSLCTWEHGMDRMRGTFGRQALPMVWDYAETNPFAGAGGDIGGTVQSLCEVLDALVQGKASRVNQADATTTAINDLAPLICTDPPYYDNIGYAELSDFFYVWLRRSLGAIYPELFATLLTPKTQELVAMPYRFDGNSQKARAFFEQGLGRAFGHMREFQHANYPLTLFYAFKQAETDGSDDGDGSGASTIASTGWETMLTGLIRANFIITGTWPMRSELSTRNVGRGTNALASSIVLVCRPRPESAPLGTRREFIAILKRELPNALRNLQKGNIAPVDLAQAAIGPGMAVFSRYSKVLEPDGTPMSVRSALALINQALDEVLAEQESEYDPETRWAVAWFEQFAMSEGPFGAADVLARAKNSGVNVLVEAEIVAARGGKVRLLTRDELPADWNPTASRRVTVWEVAQQLIRTLDRQGEGGAAALLAKVGDLGEVARDLAYRLFNSCERKGWAQEALPYNTLVVAWPEIARIATRNERSQMDRLL